MLVQNFDDAVVVREANAEVLGWAQLSTRLLANSSAIVGALSVMRTTMGEGTEGARSHTHTKSAELFYVLEGELQILTGERVITAGKGDLVVVPPNMAHAFATAPGYTANVDASRTQDKVTQGPTQLHCTHKSPSTPNPSVYHYISYGFIPYRCNSPFRHLVEVLNYPRCQL